MNRPRVGSVVLMIVLAVLSTASSCDEDYNCSDACHKLAGCENEWLNSEDKPAMSQSEYSNYIDACYDDCSQGANDDEIECVQDATCQALREGRCSD